MGVGDVRTVFVPNKTHLVNPSISLPFGDGWCLDAPTVYGDFGDGLLLALPPLCRFEHTLKSVHQASLQGMARFAKILEGKSNHFFFPRATHAHTTFNPVYADHLCFYCVFLWVSLDRLEPHFLEELHSWICIICWSKGFVQQGPQIQCPHSPELVENLYDPPILGCQKQLISTIRFLHKTHPLTIAASGWNCCEETFNWLLHFRRKGSCLVIPLLQDFAQVVKQKCLDEWLVLLLHQWLLATTFDGAEHVRDTTWLLGNAEFWSPIFIRGEIPSVLERWNHVKPFPCAVSWPHGQGTDATYQPQMVQIWKIWNSKTSVRRDPNFFREGTPFFLDNWVWVNTYRCHF